MRLLAIPLAVIGLVLALQLSAPIIERWEDSNQHQRQLDRLNEQDYQFQQEATAEARALGANALQLLLVLGIAGGLWMVLDGYMKRREPIVRVQGIPIARHAITSEDQELVNILAAQIRASGIAQIAAAQQPGPVAHSLTYSPRYSAPAQLGQALEQQPLLTAPSVATVPTFASLLDQGKIGPDAEGRAQPLLLGFNAETGEPIEGSWKSLYSAGIGALQGAGKSWLEAFLLGQSALQGAKIICCDPHAGHDSESLASRIATLAPAFLCDVAQTDREILAALKLANDELELRKAGKGSSYPIVVAIDEWTSLLRGELGALLPTYATNFAEQGRKFGVNALLSAQGWSKDVSGDVRNRLTSHYVLRQRPDEARYQTGLRAAQLPGDIRTLPDATGYLLTVKGDFVKVQIPQMTAADLGRVGAMLGGKASGAAVKPAFGFRPAGAARNPAETQMKPGFESRESSLGSATTLDPQSARILALFAQGLSVGEIVKAIFGEISGPKYNQARATVEQAIRQAVAR